jgi:hypothetical protein
MCDVFFFVVALDLRVGDYCILWKPILMAVHSEAQVCSCFADGVMGSNLLRAWMFVSCAFCVL